MSTEKTLQTCSAAERDVDLSSPPAACCWPFRSYVTEFSGNDMLCVMLRLEQLDVTDPPGDE